MDVDKLKNAPYVTRPMGGRPPKEDWEALKPHIAGLCERGYGCKAMAKFLGVAPKTVREVLKRLGLKTLYQQPAS